MVQKKDDIKNTLQEKLRLCQMTEEDLTHYLYQLANPKLSDEIKIEFSKNALIHFDSLISNYPPYEIIHIAFENQAHHFLSEYCTKHHLNEQEILYSELLSLLTNPTKRKAYHAFHVFKNSTIDIVEKQKEKKLEAIVLNSLNHDELKTDEQKTIAILKALKKQCKIDYAKNIPFYFSKELSLFSLATTFDFNECNPIEALRKTLYEAYKDSALISDEEKEEIKNLMNQYGIHSLTFRTNQEMAQVLTELKHYIDSTKKIFNIEDTEFGEGQLNINLVQVEDGYSIKGFKEANEKLGQVCGVYDNDRQTLALFKTENKEEACMSFLHEYTHFRQSIAHFHKTMKKDFNALYEEVFLKPTPNKNLENIDKTMEVLKKYIKHIDPIKEYVLKEIQSNENGFFYEMKRKKEIKNLVLNSVNQFDEKIKNWELVYTIIQNNILGFNQNHSYEQNIWQKRDKKNKQTYWLDAMEIHARINTELYNQNYLHSEANQDKDFSHETLNQLNSKMPKFNQLCLDIFREMKKENQYKNKLMI